MTDDLVNRLRQPECVYSEDKTIAFWFSSTDKFAAADRIEELEAALSNYICGCKEDKCTPEKPRYRDIKCGWPARQALEGKKDE